MSRASAQEFLHALFESLDDLPPEFAQRFEEVLKKDDVDRSQAIRQLFEDFACEGTARGAGVPLRPASRAARSAGSILRASLRRASPEPGLRPCRPGPKG